MFCYRSYTVRTFNCLERAHLEPRNDAECIAIGDAMLAGKVLHAGQKTAIEMYRAGGLGVSQINDKLDTLLVKKLGNARICANRVKQYCEYIDDILHQATCFEC